MSLTPADHDLRIDSPWSIGARSGLVLLVALVPAILVLDFVAGRGISLHLFYLVPVALAAWNLGARAGFAIAGAAGAAWAFVAISARGPGDTWGLVAWDILSTIALFLFVAHLVARHRGFVDGLRALARVDSETGALSRREFDRLCEAEVRRSKRYRRPLALLLFDLGEAKTGGRGRLAAAARSMLSQVRECDSVARLAPRRFGVLLIECKPPEPLAVVERLRETLVTNLGLRKQDLAIAVATYGGSLPASSASLLALAENHLNLARSGSGVAETRVD
ncbi:MAG: GGDEF domain-containing protein [Betaproteobacteria bacterium]|nr:GGDEF domain-containing protein [Betaproteobacteria bacterium]